MHSVGILHLDERGMLLVIKTPDMSLSMKV